LSTVNKVIGLQFFFFSTEKKYKQFVLFQSETLLMNIMSTNYCINIVL